MVSFAHLLFLIFGELQAQSLPLEPIRERYGFPAIASAAMVSGELKSLDVAGVRKVGAAAKLDVSDKLHIGSITKSMTATLVGVLIEAGKLRWETTLGDLFPEVHPSMKPVSVEMLLAHRAGLAKGTNSYPDLMADAYRGEEPPFTALEDRKLLSRALMKRPSLHPPGGAFIYSNLGYVMLGHILEHLTGKSWEELIKAQLFLPLNMNSCGFGAPDTTGSVQQPWGHFKEEDEIKAENSDNHELWGPAGRVHCNLQDLMKYFELHVKREKLLKKDTFTKLHTSYPGQKYTFGGWLRYERSWGGGWVLYHDGTNLRNVAISWIAPSVGTALFAFANIGGSNLYDVIFTALDEVVGEYLKQLRAP